MKFASFVLFITMIYMVYPQDINLFLLQKKIQKSWKAV